MRSRHPQRQSLKRPILDKYFSPNPYFKAFWAAENIVATIHDICNLRGALVRDALEWSKQINVALYKYGQQAEVMFASHSWPRWGNDRIQEVMRAQRDTYAHLNNGVLYLANQGVTINQVHNVYPDNNEKFVVELSEGSNIGAEGV